MFTDRRLSNSQNDFSSTKAYNTQAVRAKSDPKQAYILGCACENGKASGSYEADEEWFKLAAEGGIPDAQYKVGLQREQCEDFFKAILWYKRAADKGLIETKCKLANFYLTGVSIREKTGRNSGLTTVYYQTSIVFRCRRRERVRS